MGTHLSSFCKVHEAFLEFLNTMCSSLTVVVEREPWRDLRANSNTEKLWFSRLALSGEGRHEMRGDTDKEDGMLRIGDEALVDFVRKEMMLRTEWVEPLPSKLVARVHELKNMSMLEDRLADVAVTATVYSTFKYAFLRTIHTYKRTVKPRGSADRIDSAEIILRDADAIPVT